MNKLNVVFTLTLIATSLNAAGVDFAADIIKGQQAGSQAYWQEQQMQQNLNMQQLQYQQNQYEFNRQVIQAELQEQAKLKQIQEKQIQEQRVARDAKIYISVMATAKQRAESYAEKPKQKVVTGKVKN